MKWIKFTLLFWILCNVSWVAAQTVQVVDIPTRPGVQQRILLITPENPKAAAILFAGGAGDIGISDDGQLRNGGNFLIRSRELFAANGVQVAVIDKPSDRADLVNFRETAAHVADVKAVMAWMRNRTKLPLWLVGTSRGTQSAAYVAVQLKADAQAPDGLVLTSTMLSDQRDTPVPEMPLDTLTLPVLVVHHEQDGCKHCQFEHIPQLMGKLAASQRKQLLSFSGGQSEGNECGARAYHGYNGIERAVVDKIAAWMLE